MTAFDEAAFIEAGLYDSAECDPFTRWCRTCRRAPDAHDLKCGAAMRFGLPRRAYPDHEHAIGPPTRGEWERGEERRQAREESNRLLKSLYAADVDHLVYSMAPRLA